MAAYNSCYSMYMFIINQSMTSKEWHPRIKLKEKMLLYIINGLQMIFYLVTGTFSSPPHAVLNINHGVCLHVYLTDCKYRRTNLY
jgi:hypothetical protein